ncbi:hypothetical protein SDC9_199665 [bioreactor metagenome]|uniref:Uncharacterized protein n=1 Tax=bioreactor metagenome TaxID=1076179 RepID=A0A645IXS4_9ZZZZ
MQQETTIEMKKITDRLEDLGIRDQIRVMIGGACVDDGVTHLSVGADYGTKDVTKAELACRQVSLSVSPLFCFC